MNYLNFTLQNTKRSVAAKSVAVASLLLASSASFAAIDAGVTTAISEVSADITTVGGLIIGLAVVAMGIKWVKATFF